MLATGARARTVFLILALCLTASSPALSQSPAFFSASKSPDRRSISATWLAKCQPQSVDWLTETRRSDPGEWPATGNAAPGDFAVSSARDPLCAESAPLSATPRAPIDDYPCASRITRTGVVPGAAQAPGCTAPADTISAELSGLGKEGAKIFRAREDVLDILRSENACSEWFAAKDPSAAETFQSLNFLLDKDGPREVLESQLTGDVRVWRHPYVARAMQDGGARTAITINAYGAFYRIQGPVLKASPEGGPVQTDGARVLKVGSYLGDTHAAQIVTLLHEFGHVIDLLPEDADDLDGKSVHNTDEVLRHCRAEVEARAKHTKQTASR